MATADAQLPAFEAATAAYERGRLAFAVRWALPALLLPLSSLALGSRLGSVLGLGLALVAALAFGLFRGGTLLRSAVTGLEAGLLPLALAHAAQLYGHVCTPAGCSTLCVPACAAGGLLAGAFIAVRTRRAERPLVATGAAAGLALLTGSLGCSCVGYFGVLALVGGLLLSLPATRLLVRAR